MSVHCREDGNIIYVKDESFCVTAGRSRRFSAVCGIHIAAADLYEKFSEPVEGGLDVHFLFGRPSGLTSDPIEDSMSYRKGLQFGEYRFSIGPLAARLILPETSRLYLD